jgi:hypothetical protein
MWVTLFALYLVNIIADYAAAATMEARHIGELRWGVGGGGKWGVGGAGRGDAVLRVASTAQ